MIKKMTCIGILFIMFFSMVACGEEPPHTEVGNSSEYSCIVFDNKKFDIENATATLYFGNSSIKPWARPWDEGHLYAQAFFSSVPAKNVWEVILNDPAEEIAAIMQQIDEMPLESTAENIYTENIIYVVHHETIDAYFAGEYEIDEKYNQEFMRLESVYFHHSQRIKIPAELFAEDEGVISFIYYTMFYVNDAFPIAGGQHVAFSYKKKKGKIILEDKIIYSDGLSERKAKVENLKNNYLEVD